MEPNNIIEDGRFGLIFFVIIVVCVADILYCIYGISTYVSIQYVARLSITKRMYNV